MVSPTGPASSALPRAQRRIPAARHQLLGLPTLLLDVPLTTASDIALVRALCSRSPEMLVTVPANDAVTLARLRSGLGAEIVDLDSRVLRPSSGKKRMDRCRGFSVTFSMMWWLLRRRNSTSRSSSSRPREKAVNALRLSVGCLALAREGIAFDRMAVLLRSPQEYRSHLEEAFGRANVPVYFARGAVRPDPAGRAFHALLCCAAENLSARRFAEYLSLSQVPDAKPDGSPPEAAPCK